MGDAEPDNCPVAAASVCNLCNFGCSSRQVLMTAKAELFALVVRHLSVKGGRLTELLMPTVLRGHMSRKSKTMFWADRTPCCNAIPKLREYRV